MEERCLPERCRGCVHSGRIFVTAEKNRMRACLYILDRYEPRGCPADESCDRFEAGVRRKEWYIEPVYFG